jgi:hypothetical protein
LYIYVPLLQCLVGKPEPEFLKIFKWRLDWKLISRLVRVWNVKWIGIVLDCPTDLSASFLSCRPASPLFCWLVCPLSCRPASPLFCWSVCPLSCRPAGPLSCWPIFSHSCRSVCPGQYTCLPPILLTCLSFVL